MISNNNNRKIVIHITTYKKHYLSNIEDMSQNKKDNKCLCSICLGNKFEPDMTKKSCAICQRKCATCKDKERKIVPKACLKNTLDVKSNTKTTQTTQADVAQGLNLLNEVLTVFQSKKQLDTKSKSGLFKDIGISTDNMQRKSTNLSVSKVQQFSIVEGMRGFENGRFSIVNFCQPNSLRRPQYSIELIKHKSSSIPQMKMDELKNSLKEKTKSKDAIEEVNRMFANVKRIGADDNFETNRPLTRSGPRVLPVVKTLVGPTVVATENVHKTTQNQTCKCCQTNNYYLSSGDSFVKPECCHHRFPDDKKCDKCVYMLCCHYQQHCRQMQAGVMICDNCRHVNNDYSCHEKMSSVSVFEDSC